jgi:hypothetical protein
MAFIVLNPVNGQMLKITVDHFRGLGDPVCDCQKGFIFLF